MAEYDKYLPEILEALKSIKPLKIILIGSYADGTVDKDSDLDLVIILDKTSISKNYQEQMDNRLLVRRCIYEFSKMIPIDLIVYTKGEFQQITELGTSFYREINSTGKILYEKAG